MRNGILSLMSTKSIAMWIGAIIIIAGGAFLIVNKTSGPSSPATGQEAAVAAATTDSASSTANQVQGQDVTIGTGAEAKPGAVVSVLYVGKLPDGTVFDSSEAHNNEPLTFTLGQQGLIPGFQIGVNGMKEGGERYLAIPPALGYGTQDVKDDKGNVIIPANSTLLFDVRLVKVEPAKAQ